MRDRAEGAKVLQGIADSLNVVIESYANDDLDIEKVYDEIASIQDDLTKWKYLYAISSDYHPFYLLNRWERYKHLFSEPPVATQFLYDILEWRANIVYSNSPRPTAPSGVSDGMIEIQSNFFENKYNSSSLVVRYTLKRLEDDGFIKIWIDHGLPYRIYINYNKIEEMCIEYDKTTTTAS